MGNGNRPEGRVNLYDVVMEIAAELADAHAESWQKAGRDDDLRRDVALAMNKHGVDTAAILPQIKRALMAGEIAALSTFNGLPSLDADEVIPDSDVWRPDAAAGSLQLADVCVLREWCLTEDDADTVRRLCGLLPSSPGPRARPEAPSKPVQRGQAQEEEILAAIRAEGYEPGALPVVTGGRPGVKAAVRKAVGNSGMWSGKRVFDKAWERLRARGEIADEK